VAQDGICPDSRPQKSSTRPLFLLTGIFRKPSALIGAVGLARIAAEKRQALRAKIPR
jgi:hypothetical protein